MNETLISFIEDLKWFKKKKRTLDEGKRYIFKKRGFRHIHIRNFHDFNKHNFFRVRGLHSSEDETLITTHSYPPKDYNRLGRCNLKSKPVFYGALDPVTAIYEYLNTGNENEFIHLSQWNMKNKVSIETFNIMPNPSHDSYTRDSDGRIIEYSNDLLDELFDLIIHLYNETTSYEFSAPFSYFLLYRTGVCKMIQYPSITTKISKCVAINTDFFDQNFYLAKVYKLKVHSKTEPRYYEGKITKGAIVSDLEVGNISNDKIKYGEPSEDDYNFWNFYRMFGNEKDGYEFMK